MPDPSIRTVIHLSPDDTVRAFEARDRLRATVRWSEMMHEEHARAFTVAKVANLDLLAEIQASLADMLANGGTFEHWQANLVPFLKRQGWWGEVQDRSLTGTDEVVHVGARRLRTIYDTNLRVSRAAGRWARIQELKDVRPFLRYVAVMDSRTRPEHRRWHGVILPVDHPWWDTHFPPCGWFCRCTVRQLSQREMTAKGWTVSDVPDDGPPVAFTPAGAASIAVPAGISPGFGYNPGKASLRAVAEKAMRSLEAAAPVDLAAARATLDDLVQSDAFLETLHEPGGVFPVMVLAPDLSAAIGSEAHVVRLSSDTFAKQLGRTGRSEGHPELSVADYRQLPQIGAAPDAVYRQGDNRLLLFREGDGRQRLAVVKAAAGGRELYLVSYRFANPRTIAQLIAGADRIDL
ncbi:MAG: phage minor head protein [Sphingomonas aquatilis]|jgi:SPP1 gp7 family putative phage head morphogenesis protein|uniref:phage head morphogenesis protein n=1 Tax=Sphingomonas aquatilis TaxID=93063 RepID=UPI002F3213B6